MEKHKGRRVEWRRIPEFPAYEINLMGDVRLIGSDRELIEFWKDNPTGSGGMYCYSLWKGGVEYHRRVIHLVESVFPEWHDK